MTRRGLLILLALLAAPSARAEETGLLPDGQDQITLPFTVQDGFILLSGQVAGVTGVFMFDTGTPFPFLLNNLVVPLPLDGPGSPAQAGSGQRFTVHAHPEAGPVTLGDHRLADTGPVVSGDLVWLHDEFRPDFLGFAGYALIRDHEMVLDYQAGAITLYRLDAAGLPLVDHGLRSAAAIRLPFDGFDDGREQLPVVKTLLAGVPIDVMFDTGTDGYLDLTAEARATLLAAGALILAPDGSARLNGLRLGGRAVPGAVSEVHSPAPRNRLTMGYRSLVQMRSVWNYRRGEILLLPLD